MFKCPLRCSNVIPWLINGLNKIMSISLTGQNLSEILQKGGEGII